MFKNIETYIQPFAAFLPGIMRKEYNTDPGLPGFVDEIPAEFKNGSINLLSQEDLLFFITYIPHICPNFYVEVIRGGLPLGADFPLTNQMTHTA
ncbi:MAG TPA: hypothetical protein VFE53_03825 [Mucilaginibacter sp.]|jgi:hypothetical protein|nr:hypothetical protein [Mucilaginibacter sp.]